jgi:hypothetical protein
MRSIKEVQEYSTKYVNELSKLRDMQIPDSQIKYSTEELGISDFDKKMVKDDITFYEMFVMGKVSALRYVTGGDWDYLNTEHPDLPKEKLVHFFLRLILKTVPFTGDR